MEIFSLSEVIQDQKDTVNSSIKDFVLCASLREQGEARK